MNHFKLKVCPMSDINVLHSITFNLKNLLMVSITCVYESVH